MGKAFKLLVVTFVICILFAQTIWAVQKQAKATISIYRDQLIDIKPEVFGQNVTGGSIFASHGGGIWKPDAESCADGITGCWNDDALNAAKDGGYTVLGFPGGYLTRVYDWTKGVAHNGSPKEYPFGILEFLLFAREVGAEPILGVSMYDPETGEFASQGAIDKAVALVEFCNGTSGEWAQLRQDLGYAEPFNVKYWTIDYYPWEEIKDPLNPSVLLQNIAPAMYAQQFVNFSTAMKEVDSSILLGAPSYMIFDESHFASLLSTFVDPNVVPQEPDLWPDFFFDVYFRPSFNRYYCNVCSWTPEQLQEFIDETMFPTTLAAPTDFVLNYYDTAKNLLATTWAAYPDKVQHTFFALTNYHSGITLKETCTDTTPDEPCPLFKYVHSLGSAFYTADLLMKLIQLTADKLLLAQHWTLADKTDATDPTSPAYSPSHFGALKVLLNPDWSNTTIVRRPDQLVFELFSKNRGQKIAKTSVASSSFDTPDVTWTNVPAITGIQTQEGEAFLRIRIVRKDEPTGSDANVICGSNDSQNPDPSSSIVGAFMLDNFYLASESNPAQNLVANSGFEDGLSGWNYTPHASVTTEVASDKSKQNHYLKLVFANNNPYYSNLSQIIQVQPNTRYFLKYWVKSNSLYVKTRNLLCDGSFDFGTGVPGSWWHVDSSSGVTVSVVNSGCYSEPNCVRLYFAPGTDPELWHVWQQKPYHWWLDPQTYIVKAKVKTENMVGRARLEFYARKPDDEPFNNSLPLGIFGTTQWLDMRKSIKLYDPQNTALLGVRLRRQKLQTQTETGGYAYYDDIRLYRDPQNYTPGVAVDLCTDEVCSSPRTVIFDQPKVLGTVDWQVRELSGLPYLSAITLADDNEHLKLFVINRSTDTDVEANITLYVLGKAADDDVTDVDAADDDDSFEGWIVESQVLYGINGFSSTNEEYDPNNPDSEPEVEYSEPEEVLRTTESGFSYTFEPSTLTVLNIHYNRPGDDDDAGDDDADDDTDGGGGGESGICGCGCSI